MTAVRALSSFKTAQLVLMSELVSGTPVSPILFARVSLVTVLWLCLYEINEQCDRVVEDGLPISVLPSSISILGVLASTSLSALISVDLTFTFCAMLISQLAYCLPGIRMKRFWWFCVLASGVVNPFFRTLFPLGPDSGMAMLFTLMVIPGHIAGSLYTRLARAERDASIGSKPVPEWTRSLIRPLFLLSALIACVALFSTHGLGSLVFGISALIAIGFSAFVGNTDNLESARKMWAFAFVGVVVSFTFLIARY